MSSVFNKVRTILHEKFSFHYDQIQLTTNLEVELGLDSREFFELLSELEESFQIEIDLDEIDRITKNKIVITIEDIVNYITEQI
jgi:acyl carrier protein